MFVGFGASSLDFSIRAWTHDFGDWVNIRSNMCARVYEALTAAGIEIPFPQQTCTCAASTRKCAPGWRPHLLPGNWQADTGRPATFPLE